MNCWHKANATPALKNMHASATERKLAAWVASMALAGVLGVVVWQYLFAHTANPGSQPHPVGQHVTITEKPKPLHHHPTSTPRSFSPKNEHTKVKPPQSQPEKKQINIGKGNFFVQVGAFIEKHKAQAMYQKMKNTYKRAILTSKGKYHAVWVGPVRSRNEADILKAQILKRYKIKGFIVLKNKNAT